jgi:hypothetical protein
MRWLVLAMLVGCAEPTGLGVASATAYPSATSATVIVANGSYGLTNFRVWSIEIGESPSGSDCKNREDALVVFDVFTQLSSAPRGVIPLTAEVPPILFPAVYAHYANGFSLAGEMVIDAASTTRMVGSFVGTANLDGATSEIEVVFDAPTCGI